MIERGLVIFRQDVWSEHPDGARCEAPLVDCPSTHLQRRRVSVEDWNLDRGRIRVSSHLLYQRGEAIALVRGFDRIRIVGRTFVRVGAEDAYCALDSPWLSVWLLAQPVRQAHYALLRWLLRAMYRLGLVPDEALGSRCSWRLIGRCLRASCSGGRF